MDKCQYIAVNDSEKRNIIKQRTVQWKPFLRQMLICSGGFTSMFLYGFCVGGPTVFIPQIRKEANSTDVITDDMASWLSAAFSFCSIPFIIIMTLLGKFIGRKKSFIIGAVDLLVGFIILYYSANITQILISQLIHGLSNATQLTILFMIFTEYTSPSSRGLFLIMKTTIFYWSVWVVNAIGTFWHWKMIPLVGMIYAVYVIFIAIICPESPYWLASKGKFEECAIAHRWLKGCDEESERELETLINSQKEFVAKNGDNINSFRKCFTFFFKTVKSKEFYKPNLIALTTLCLSYLCGKILCMVYALDIIKKMTNSEPTVSCGPLTMGHSFFGELVPVRSRNLSFCLILLGSKLLDAILLKTGPFIFKACGLHGFFLIFGICSSTVILILNKYLPETKNKTLQEIANIINDTAINKRPGHSSFRLI